MATPRNLTLREIANAACVAAADMGFNAVIVKRTYRLALDVEEYEFLFCDRGRIRETFNHGDYASAFLADVPCVREEKYITMQIDSSCPIFEITKRLTEELLELMPSRNEKAQPVKAGP